MLNRFIIIFKEKHFISVPFVLELKLPSYKITNLTIHFFFNF